MVATTALLLAAPVAAQTELTPSAQADAARLRVSAATTIVAEDSPLDLRLRVGNPQRTDREDLRVVVTVHGSTTTRFALQQALQDGPATSVVHAVTADVDAVPGGGARDIRIVQNREELGLTGADGNVNVHPVRIALQADGELVDEALTAAVVPPEDADVSPLNVGLLLPIAGPPAGRPDGDIDAAALDAVAGPDAPLPGLLAALRQQADVPVTLATDGMTAHYLHRAREGLVAVEPDGTRRARVPEGPSAQAAGRVLDDLAAVVASEAVDQIPLPYGAADLDALVRHGATQEAVRHVGDATGDVERVTGVRPQSRTLWPAEGVDGPTLAALRGALDTVVLSERHLDAEDPPNLTPEAGRRLQAGEAGTLRALVPDPWIEAALADAPEDGTEPALLAARIVAELAAVHQERPGVAERGLLIAPPQRQTPTAELVGPLLRALQQAEFLQPVELAALRSGAATGEVAPATLAYPAGARLDELPPGYVGQLRSARTRLGSLDAVLTEERGLVAALDRRLLQAASTAYRDDPEAGVALLGSIEDTVSDVYAAVEVPESPPVTLTAEEGTLPVSLTSHADVPLRVQVTLRTPAYEVIGGPSREVVLPPGRTELLSVDVRALAPGGTSPVQVVVTDPDGVSELASGTIVVRSTAFSVAAVVITAAAAVFLLAMLWREASRRRAPGRPEPAPQPRVRTGAPR